VHAIAIGTIRTILQERSRTLQLRNLLVNLCEYLCDPHMASVWFQTRIP